MWPLLRDQIAQATNNTRLMAKAIASGIVIGALMFAAVDQISDGFKSFMVAAAIAALSLILFIHWASKESRVTVHTLAAVLLVILLGGLAIIPVHGDSFEAVLGVAFPLVSMAAIGVSVISMKAGEKESYSKSFFVYLQKLVEIWLVSGALFIATGLLGALFGSLLNIIDIHLSNRIVMFLMLAVFSTIALLVVTMTYDFGKPVREQIPVVGIIKLFSLVAYGFSFIVAAFLFLYITILLPSGFERIFKTGATVPTFMGLTLVTLVLMYGALLHKEFTKNDAKGVPVLVALTIMSFEVLVMSAVSLVAMWKRVDQYGLTFDRLLGLFFIVVAISLGVSLVYAVLHGALRHQTVQAIKSYVEYALFAALGALVAIVFAVSIIDIELLTAKMHVKRVRANSMYLSYDQGLLLQSGPRVYEYMVEDYASLDRVNRVGTIVAISYMTYTFSDYPTYEDYNAVKNRMFDRMSALEADPVIKDFIGRVRANKAASCETLVKDILQGDGAQVEGVCGNIRGDFRISD